MNKKKLKYITGGIILTLSVIYIDLSFSKKEATIVENIEALAENEVDIFDLCKKTGGHCMVSITQNILGICIDHD